MATSHIINLIRLFVAFSLPISVVGQERVIMEYEDNIIIGHDAVIYIDPSNQKYTTDPNHPYFEDYSIDLSIGDHIKNMEALIIELESINDHIKKEYIDNPSYYNTSDNGAINTRTLIREQYAKRSFCIFQYRNTVRSFKGLL
jgi:hypothetical protein